MFKDPAARLVSPFFLILAGLCFLLPFAGVSCNTTTARTFIDSFPGAAQSLGGQGSGGPSARQVDACLNALGGFSFYTYNGVDLVAGSDPTVASPSSEPAACASLSSSASSSGVSTSPGASAHQVNVGVQPLFLVALAAILAGLLLGLFRYAARGLVVAVSAGAGIILLLVASSTLSSAVLDRLGAAISSGEGQAGGSAASLPPGIDLSSFFSVSLGLGLILAIVALAVVVLYNLVSFGVAVSGGGRRWPALAGGYGASAPGPPSWPPGGPPPMPPSPEGPGGPPPMPPPGPPPGSYG
jgi:hypothetical protein